MIEPSGHGGTNWSPMPYSPDTGYLYVPGTVGASAFVRIAKPYVPGKIYLSGSQDWPFGTRLAGTFTAIDGKTNKIVWQHKMPYQMGGGSGSTVTAGGLLLRGEPDGNLVAVDAENGNVLWKFQTGFGADAPPVVYEVDGNEYIAIATGGNSIQQSATGDAVWAFSLQGRMGPAWWPPTRPPTGEGLGLYWRLRSALLSLWQGHGHDWHLEQPTGQHARGDTEDR